jgi:hypothetical protein
MARIDFRGFVCDEDALWVDPIIRKTRYGRVLTLAQIGITKNSGSPDDAIVQHARDHGAIIVTSNSSDFRKCMDLAAKRCTAGECCEGCGLITVPSGLGDFSFARISRKLRFNDLNVDWEDVFMCNLRVTISKLGEPHVSKLPMCDYFKKDHCAECDRCLELGFVDP